MFSQRITSGIFGFPPLARLALGGLGFLGLLGFFSDAEAASPTLTYRFRHHLFTITTADMRDWETMEETWTYRGEPIEPPAALRVDGDSDPSIPLGFERHLQPSWDRAAIMQTLEGKIGTALRREPGSVEIRRNASGAIVFEGEGLPGRGLDADAAALLTIAALKQGIRDIFLPILETQPLITVTDPDLRKSGIRELVAIGESSFRGSTRDRMHNIRVGLNRFSGHQIPKGETFSFVKVLGPVDASTGYRKELTIKGDVTIPDYGGGLCQVSSTAYRGVWEYGFPITQRKNHSYAVSYYAPQGTDATVYPPSVDIKFLNDSPGDLLIQTVMDEAEMKAWFLYYGTKDDRDADIVGPFIWGNEPPPPPRTEETTEIAPGTRRKVGEAVPGMKAAWFRIIHQGGDETIEGTYSVYEARPLFWQIGIEAGESNGSGTVVENIGETE